MQTVVRLPLATALGTTALLLAACVAPGTEITALPARIDYACAGERTLTVFRAPDLRSASVVVGEREFVLPRADGGGQEKYSDGRLTLYLDGERAMLEDLGRVLYGPCQSVVPLPTMVR